MSLRARITIAAAGAVAAVAIVLGAIGYFPARAELINQVRQELHQLALPYLQAHGDDEDRDDRARGRHGQAGGQVCQASNHPGPDRSQLGGATGYFQSVCSDGRAIADQGGTPELPVTPRVLTIAKRASGSEYFSATVRRTHVEILAVGDGPDHKAIEVALPLTGVDALLEKFLMIFLVLVGVGILLAGIVGLAIARAALAPILTFSRRTERVAAELERPQRLEETGAPELRRLAASFNQTLAALERSIEAQRHLIADASHELRTPMAALRSNVQIFLESERLPEPERRELQTSIVAELDDLTQLVADVLDLARGAGPDDHVEAIELDDLVRDAVARTSRRAPSLRFTLDLEPTIVCNNPDRVARAARNVLDNARKWSQPDGAIEVALRDGVLAVRDHGPGFDADDLGHVFDRFYRSEGARGTPGAGLGLAIIKQAAEARGGSATAANASNGGAVVRVTFGPDDEGGDRVSNGSTDDDRSPKALGAGDAAAGRRRWARWRGANQINNR